MNRASARVSAGADLRPTPLLSLLMSCTLKRNRGELTHAAS